MKLYEYIIRRLILLVFVLFAVSAIVFYLTRGFPKAAAAWAPYVTSRMTAQQIEDVKIAHGFDKPILEQYFYWLRDIFRGSIPGRQNCCLLYQRCSKPKCRHISQALRGQQLRDRAWPRQLQCGRTYFTRNLPGAVRDGGERSPTLDCDVFVQPD